MYTGQRNGDFDVYKIPAAGGDEIRLTSTPGLDDGPEYTPDGTYIYFNSARSGRMQIWRMRPDGSGQQQITNDGFNNWFPHISPDGKWIVYISFPPDVAADDHPFYKHVMLRLMPIGGGPARVIAYVYGGQGTINVPSWSPDGKRLAFVSNTHAAMKAEHLLVGSVTADACAECRWPQQAGTSPAPDDRFKADILVIAPHPDDESTIAGYLARAVLDEHRRVAVVVTTRGDAGQNLVGYEQARSLAEIREMETRQALASIGITNVWFLRAPDTWAQDVSDVLRSLETSNHGSSLGEAVRFIRLTRPDVVITISRRRWSARTTRTIRRRR